MNKIIFASIIGVFAVSNTQAQNVKTFNANWSSEKIYLQPDASSYTEDVTYYNELGSPTQHIGIQASPTGYNILQPIYYDEMLRDSVRSYLPVVTESTTGQMFADHLLLSRYQQTYGTTENGYVYDETTYDNCITNRRIANTNVGSIFREHQKTASYKYEVNNDDDILKIEMISNDEFAVNGTWQNGLLRKVSFRNEDGGRTIRFTDMQQNVILERMTDGTEYLDTYYVYDPLNRLCWVIPPECSNGLMTGSYSLDSQNVARYCYRYDYDSRGRIVSKKIPGCDAVSYVYDRNDRPAMTQDGNMRKSNGWTYVQYDPHGRPETTYYLELANKTQAQLQALFDAGQTDELQNDTSKQLLSRCYYDGIADDGTYSPSSEAVFRPVEGILENSDVNRNRKGYKTREELAVINPDKGYKSTIRRTFYYDHRGRLIQTVETNCFGSESCTTVKYDFCGNILKIHESHMLKFATQPDILLREYTYDTRGRKLSETTTLNDGAPVVVTYAYDNLGRLASTTTGTGANARTTTYAYNIQGWLTQKSSPDLTIDFHYYKPNNLATQPSYTGNISEILWYRDGLKKNAAADSYFYDELSRQAKVKHYLRKPAKITFDSLSPIKVPIEFYYIYTYQHQDSLVYDRNGNITSFTREKKDAYTVNREYTLKGNQIDEIHATILLANPFMPEDSDRVEHMQDEEVAGKKIPIAGDIEDYLSCYVYDSNGNMTYDWGNQLKLRYNRLNLVEKVIKADTVYANYSYLADGTKLTATDKDGNGFVYLGSLVYRQEDARQPVIKFEGNAVSPQSWSDYVIWYHYNLESAPFDGGRLAVTQVAGANVYTPQYYMTDHLGSVRTLIDGGSGETVEKNDYYAFGERIDDPENEISDNRYRYNGKEEQAFLKLPFIDYGARMYDPKIGMRWNRPDPLAEQYPHLSPYAFCANNPVNFVDPDGRKIRIYDEMGTYQWQQRDGDWGFYNDDNILYSGQNEFIIQLSSALKGIMNGGNVGYELVRDLANHANIMTIMQSDRSGADRNNQVGWNPTGIRRDGTSESVPTADGLRNDPLITLGHELSHVVYNWSGKNAHTWFNLSVAGKDGNSEQRSIPSSEIFTTHMENLLRKENNLPLRTHYAITSDGVPTGPRIINRAGYSMYYDALGNTNYHRLKRNVVPYKY